MKLVEMKKMIIIFFVALSYQNLIAQSKCFEFESYNQSQNWIREIKSLPANQRKKRIITRLKCEHSLSPEKLKFTSNVIINGWPIYIAKDIPERRFSIIELISANNIDITHSICEGEIYPQKCNLGFIIIDGLDQPILNESKTVQFLSIKHKFKSNKIILKVHANKEIQVKINLENFYEVELNKVCFQIKLKRGKNRITIPTENSLNLVELITTDGKIILMQ